jgi:hypothetical protein
MRPISLSGVTGSVMMMYFGAADFERIPADLVIFSKARIMENAEREG